MENPKEEKKECCEGSEGKKRGCAGGRCCWCALIGLAAAVLLLLGGVIGYVMGARCGKYGKMNCGPQAAMNCPMMHGQPAPK